MINRNVIPFMYQTIKQKTMKYSFYAILLVSIFLTSSCQTGPCSSKDNFLNSFEALVGEIQENKSDLTDNDWEQIESEFNQITKECYKKYKSDLTADEKKQYWENTASYYSEKYGGDMLSLIGAGTEQLTEFFDEEMQESLLEMKEELKNIFDDEFKEDLKSAVDELVGELGKFGKELKKGIDEIEVEK